MDKPFRGYFIGSHKLRGQWFAYGWVPERSYEADRREGRGRIVFIDEAATREEAERRVWEEIERILTVRIL